MGELNFLQKLLALAPAVCWAFGERDSMRIAFDASGHARNATGQNMEVDQPPLVPNMPTSRSTHFTGSFSNVEHPYAAWMTAGGIAMPEFTAVFVYSPDSTAAQREVCGMESVWWVDQLSSGALRFGWHNEAVQDREVTSAAGLITEGGAHFVVVRKTATEFAVCIDGVWSAPVSSTDKVVAPPFMSTTGRLQFGRHSVTNTTLACYAQFFTYWPGEALSDSEIEELWQTFNASPPSEDIPEVDLERTTSGRLFAHAGFDDEMPGVFDPFDEDDWANADVLRRGVVRSEDGRLAILGDNESASNERVVRYLPAGVMADVYVSALNINIGAVSGARTLCARADDELLVNRMVAYERHTAINARGGVIEFSGNSLLQRDPTTSIPAAPPPVTFKLEVKGTRARGRDDNNTLRQLDPITVESGWVGLGSHNPSTAVHVWDHFCVMRSASVTVHSNVMQDGWFFEILNPSGEVICRSNAAVGGTAEADTLLILEADGNPPFIEHTLRVCMLGTNTLIAERTLFGDAIWPGDIWDLGVPTPSPTGNATYLVAPQCSECLLAVGDFAVLTARFRVARADDPGFADPVVDTGFGPGDGVLDDGSVYYIAKGLAPGHYLALINAVGIGESVQSPAIPFTIFDLSAIFLGGWRSGA